jgi:hypothetical protein
MLITLLSSIRAALAGDAAVRDGVMPVKATGNLLTPWLATAFLVMAATLFGAHGLVTRGRRR